MTSADLNVYGFQSGYAPAYTSEYARLLCSNSPLWLQEAEDDDAQTNREKLREDLANEIKKDVDKLVEDANADVEMPDVSDDIPNPTGAGKM